MKLLLHMCCGPCSCYPVKRLRGQGIKPVGYFFNPNIHPYAEWKMRLDAAREFAERSDMEFHADEAYRVRDFLRRALPLEPDTTEAAVEAAARGERKARCRMCYGWRLGEAARYAAENGYEAFTSTLFYSIYQMHDLMRETAERFAEQYGVKFYYEDFRPGWQEGIDISREMGLYRQPYCGCIFSEEERYSREIRKAHKKIMKARKAERLLKEQVERNEAEMV